MYLRNYRTGCSVRLDTTTGPCGTKGFEHNIKRVFTGRLEEFSFVSVLFETLKDLVT